MASLADVLNKLGKTTKKAAKKATKQKKKKQDAAKKAAEAAAQVKRAAEEAKAKAAAKERERKKQQAEKAAKAVKAASKNLTAMRKKQSTKEKVQEESRKAYERYKKLNANALGVKGKGDKDLTQEEYLRLQTAERLPSKKTKDAALGKELSKKVGKVNVRTYKKSAGAMGFMEAMTPLPVSLEDLGSGTYTTKQREKIQKAKESTAYNVGYGLGAMTSFLTNGGTGAEQAIGRGIAKKVGKGAATKTVKNATKKGGKSLAKNVTKNGVKRITKDSLDDAGKTVIKASARQARTTAARTGLSKGQQFVANRVADVGAGTYFNLNEAAKAGQTEDGWDSNEALKSFVTNTAFDTAFGGLIEGGGAAYRALKGSEYRKLIRIVGKRQNGEKLTAEEGRFYDTAMSKIRKANADKAADEAVAEVRRAAEQAKNTQPEVQSSARSVQPQARSAEVNTESRTGTPAGQAASAQPARATVTDVDTGSLNRIDRQIKDGQTTSRVTTIKNEYSGKKPLQSEVKTNVVALEPQNVSVAREVISAANGNKGAIKRAYEKVLTELGGTKVKQIKSVTFNGKAYNVSLPKNVVGKVVSDVNMSPEKLAVFDQIDEIITEANYIGSGKYIPHNTKQKQTVRFDYFETDVKIGNDDYVVSFDVEVFPNVNNYRTHKITKIDLMKVPDADVGPEPTATRTTPSLSDDSIHDFGSKSNADRNVNSLRNTVSDMRTQGKSDMEIIDDLRMMGASDSQIDEVINHSIDDPDWNKAADDAFVNSDAYTSYKTRADEVKGENPTPEDTIKGSGKVSDEEIHRARRTAFKIYEDAKKADADAAEIMEPWLREGKFRKEKGMTQQQALDKAAKELEDGNLYKRFMDSEFANNEHLFMARGYTLLNDLMKRAPYDNKAAEQLLKTMDKVSAGSSHAGRLLNATKLILRNTPEGRLRVMKNNVANLQRRYGDRMKNGKKIELSEDQQLRIVSAQTDEEALEIATQIEKEIWEDIPATWFEKANEWRHMAMLMNARTHGRNLAGNLAFRCVRLTADALEIAAYKIPSVRNRLDKLGGSVDMVYVPHSEIRSHKKVLDKIFEANYEKSGSKNQYVEAVRPDGIGVFKSKALNKASEFNYKLLEKEDMLTYKPEYRKNFLRWCKANDYPLDKIADMPPDLMRKANTYAMQKADVATFRDDSAFARKVVGLKTATAGKKGKTAWGTAGYRLLNVALESNLPFVKTPVNIFRRSVDFSPMGFIRGLGDIATAKNAEDFMRGVRGVSTGLTGSGIMAVGMFLANKDLITVDAGEESGDAFYDRDMGYQDSSIRIRIGDKEWSWTADWLSPMQTSLFMGADLYNTLSRDGFTLDGMLECMQGIGGTMLDMSFMSSPKDTIETFMEKVYRNGTGDDADWTGAITQMLFGSMPQNYLGGFVPQLQSQLANVLDNKQRDTRSTKEGLMGSWESWERKMINKLPVVRNYVLNPKIDRFGNDVNTGDNIVMRFINSMVNPSNVKEIKRTKTDDEIIKIYNHLPEDSDDKKYFYYNFTGNPSYELANGKRMTYDELYIYGKESRKQQTKLINDMMKSGSYKNMSWEMKGEEINGSHFIGETYADRKTYGDKYTVNKIKKTGMEGDKTAVERARRAGVSDKDFVDFYITKETLINRAHDSSYETKALAVAMTGNDKMGTVYEIKPEKVAKAQEYLKKGGSAEEYTDAYCNIMSRIEKTESSSSKNNKSRAAANFDINARTYEAMGFTADQANMGIGLKKYGYSLKALGVMKFEAEFGFDLDGSGSLNKSEVMAYVDSLGLSSSAEKACVFAYLSSAKNPYGAIPNYLGMEGASSGGGGGRSYGHSSGGRRSRSSSSKSSAAKTNMPSWENYVEDYISNSEKVSGVKFKDWDSPLDQAYRNKINTILKKTKVDVS